MHNFTYRSLLFTTAFCITFSSMAQTDTSRKVYDLGRIQLDRSFTQAITIKGEDLEKMPFSNLTEVINAWLYGVYTNSNTLVYVVDGNFINDPNTYAIHEIEEVTLIQNASAVVAGAGGQRQLILITTRKSGKEKYGLTIAAQSALVKLYPTVSPSNTSSESGFYHQYHIKAYVNSWNISFGASVNYQRDITPDYKQDLIETNTQDKIDRLRLHAWFVARLGKVHELTLLLNGAQQVYDAEYAAQLSQQSVSRVIRGNNDLPINPSLRFRSSITPGLSNDLNVSYLSGKVEDFFDQINSNNTESYNSHYLQNVKTSSLLARDRLSYHTTYKNVQFSPAVTLMYRTQHFTFDNYSITTYTTQPPYILIYHYKTKAHSYSIVPSMGIDYKKIFHVEGGVAFNFSDFNDTKVNNGLPFVSASVNILQPEKTATSLQLYGSFARTSYVGDKAYYMFSLTVYNDNISGLSSTTDPGISDYQQNWQSGLQLGFLRKRITVDYTFERRNFNSMIQIPEIPSSGVNYVFSEIASRAHRVRMAAQVFHEGNFKWHTAFTSAVIKNRSLIPVNHYYYQGSYGDFNSDRTSFTGGWVNKISYKQFAAGLSLVYYTGWQYSAGSLSTQREDALEVQNAYISYTINAVKGIKNIELFADVRGISKHVTYIINDIKNYYSLGGKITM